MNPGHMAHWAPDPDVAAIWRRQSHDCLITVASWHRLAKYEYLVDGAHPVLVDFGNTQLFMEAHNLKLGDEFMAIDAYLQIDCIKGESQDILADGH